MYVNDTLWRKIRGRMIRAAASKAHVRVGVLREKGGDATTDEGITMVELATIHEYGSPAARIPERSFIRAAFRDAKVVAQITKPLAREVMIGKLPLTTALDKLGAWGAARVKNFVTQGDHIPPPLKDATVEKKGSDRPLVDTGRMIGSINWLVDTGGDE